MTETEATANANEPEKIAEMAAIVKSVIELLVDDTEAVVVSPIFGADGTNLRVQVAAGDIGKVIGKQGRTARSLRTIVGAASMKLHHRFSLDIVEEKQGALPRE
jgi:predicted RNA-binding protein YlqC (UPF0109 family)